VAIALVLGVSASASSAATGSQRDTAHAIASGLMAAREKDCRASIGAQLADVSRALLGSPLVYSDDQLATVLSARHFVEVRTTLGGPARSETARAAGVARRQLEQDEGWWTRTTEALAAAEKSLAARSAGL